jgi:hypothetical protein
MTKAPKPVPKKYRLNYTGKRGEEREYFYDVRALMRLRFDSYEAARNAAIGDSGCDGDDCMSTIEVLEVERKPPTAKLSHGRIVR